MAFRSGGYVLSVGTRSAQPTGRAWRQEHHNDAALRVLRARRERCGRGSRLMIVIVAPNYSMMGEGGGRPGPGTCAATTHVMRGNGGGPE